MGVYIRVVKIEHLCCPKCGSRRIVGLQQEYCHCGQCGMPLQIHMPQDEWQRTDVLWKSPVIEEDNAETLKQNTGTNIDKELEANTETDTDTDIDAGTETEEITEFDLEDAGMIFRPDLEEAEWEFEPVYEQLSFFPFPE